MGDDRRALQLDAAALARRFAGRAGADEQGMAAVIAPSQRCTWERGRRRRLQA